MKRILALFALLFLAGCGGTPPTPPTEFANHSAIADATLMQWWAQAQTQPFVPEGDKNPTNLPIPADPQATSILPDGVIIQVVPHTPNSIGFMCADYDKGVGLWNPMAACWGLTVYTHPEHIYLSDDLGINPSLSTTQEKMAVYEMQNVIYHRLNYDMTGR